MRARRILALLWVLFAALCGFGIGYDVAKAEWGLGLIEGFWLVVAVTCAVWNHQITEERSER